MTSPRAPLIAFVAAGLALAVATAAVVVTVVRGNGKTASAGVPPAITIEDGTVTAVELAVLRNARVVPDPAGQVGIQLPDGVAALGVLPTDVIVAVGGHEVRDQRELHKAMFNAAVSELSWIYVEVKRDGRTVVLRRTVTGDLRQAWRDSISGAAAGTTPATDPFSDPVPTMAGITRIDDTHYEVLRSVIQAELADTDAFTRTVRIVPAMKNGKPDGFKMYAVRPSSLVAALGFKNGDTIHGVNGVELSSADKALEVYTLLQDAATVDVHLSRRGRDITMVYTVR
jgi:S1-C subfamily serine protease